MTLLRVCLIVGCLLVLYFVCLCSSSDLFKPSAQTLNIHIIAHTHDDVGWLKTVDEYYIGSNSSIQNANVQIILDTVTDALVSNPQRKFIYVEMAFFWRWWNEQTEEKRQQVRRLVNEGRLEFINGGWCMNDEAAAFYIDIIDQMTLGHLFLNSLFGSKGVPTVGWHIDPFGHSSSQTRIFTQMGFNGHFFARIDYQDYFYRSAAKNLEFVWRASPKSLGPVTDMFTHSMYGTTYCFFDGFNFEWGDPPIQDDPRLFDMNVQQRSDDFVRIAQNRAAVFRTNEVLIPYGCDFQYINAQLMFKNIDKLIKYINAHPERYNAKVFYSTPSIYLDAVHKYNLTWSLKTDDFFPYADEPHAFWTGYFTSRAGFKGYVRKMSTLLHSAELLYTTCGLPRHLLNSSQIEANLFTLAEAMGIAQHHDAVSGTAKQHVDFDYSKRLSIGQFNSLNSMREILGKLMSNSPTTDVANLAYCPLMNVSICPATSPLSQGFSVPVVVYNPLGWSRETFLSIPVPNGVFKVTDSQGNVVPSQLYMSVDGVNTVVFKVSVPALGYNTYFLSKSSHVDSSQISSVETFASGSVPEDTTLDNGHLTLTFNNNGLLSSIRSADFQQSMPVQQNLAWYRANIGDKYSSQPSGAYIFRPVGNATDILSPLKINVVRGSLFQEVQTFYPWATQIFRLYTGSRVVDVQHTITPIDISDGIGKEVITKYTTPMATNQYFYTDANGLEIQQRRRNFRPTWPFVNTEPAAGNYFPVNSVIYLTDGQRQLSLVTDRSHGGSSLVDGQMEVMLQRRLLFDDRRGVGEALNENETIRVDQQLIFAPPANSSRMYRTATEYLLNPVVVFFGQTSNISDWLRRYKSTWTAIKTPLPENIKLLNLKHNPFSNDGLFILRLHHLYGVGEDPVMSVPVTINLDNLFLNHKISELHERGLNALPERPRLKWNVNSTGSESFTKLTNERMSSQNHHSRANIVTLNPMDIKTYLIRLVPTSTTTKSSG